ncbi:unnamed protein product, partial [Discosporangium mesarthrocarpum]
MFNFLFQSNLGEMIAPIKSPEAQLLIAIQNKADDKIRELIEAQGVSATSKNERGVMPMHMACQTGSLPLVQRLIELGADLLTPDSSGNTPLHYASKHGHTELVRWLVGQGVSVERRNSTRLTAYDVATNHDIRQYLLPLQLKAEAGNPEYAAPAHLGISTDTTRSYDFMPPMAHLQGGIPSPHTGGTPGHLAPHDPMSAALGALMQPASGAHLPPTQPSYPSSLPHHPGILPPPAMPSSMPPAPPAPPQTAASP